MSELLSALNRVESLITQNELDGALTVLWMAMDHAKSAEQLLTSQTKSMTEAHLKIKELTERIAYWEKRARSFEEDARNIIPATFKAWWAMVEAECDIQQEPLKDSDIALSYMGNGASCHVTAGEIREMLGCKTDDTLQELRAHGLEDHLDGVDQDA